ncbi:MAG: hypothetical protein IJX26_02225, partial [Clostridia bacterium]|nr:hypothetical protein [Clostridia bacterium]
YFKMSSKNYFIKMLFYTIMFVAISLITYYVCSLITLDWILGFVIKLSVCCALSIVLLCMVYIGEEEFQFYLKKITGLFKRKNYDKKD